MLLLLLLLLQARGTPVPTECGIQLHTYYVALGMPMAQPILPVYVFTSGVMLGTPYVQVQIRLQSVANFYESLLPSPAPLNTSFVSYVTAPIPWCATNIQFDCVYNATTGLAKTANCTTLPDYDPGGSSPVAGRMFVYSNQSAPPCYGDPTLTYFNVTLDAGQSDTWTYDVRGLQLFEEMSWINATNTYRSSTCQYSNGAPADVVTQAQFVCIESQLHCAGTRPPGPPPLQAIPQPNFACFGETMFNSSVVSVLWKIWSLVPPGGLESTYGITFVADLAFAVSAELSYLAGGGQLYILVAGTVRQFNSGMATLGQSALLFYQNYWTAFQVHYPFSANAFISLVPCLCGFSMYCDVDGNADVTSMYVGYLRLNNALPVCDPGPDQLVPFGSTSFSFSANQSYDPDNAPAPFNVLWVVMSTPYDPAPPPFNLSSPQSLDQFVNASGLMEGVYLFLLYASDLQTQIPCVLNITILGNQISTVLPNDFLVAFPFYSGAEANHSCFVFPPMPCIRLNGTLSWGTNGNVTLDYEWIQTAGYPLTFNCDPTGFVATSAFFNTTQAVACFVPPLPGTYCFWLTVSDNITNQTRSICVTVTPNFGQPPSTLTPLPNYTTPPIRNLTQPTRPELTFPPYTLPPFVTQPPSQATPAQSPPPINTTPLPIIPPVGPPTPTDWIVMGTLLAVIVAFFLFVFTMHCLYADEGRLRILEKKSFGGRGATWA